MDVVLDALQSCSVFATIGSSGTVEPAASFALWAGRARKYYIGAEHGFFQDLVDPTFAVIGLDVNYKTGAAVLTLAYNAQWNPTTQSFDVTSSLQASVQF